MPSTRKSENDSDGDELIQVFFYGTLKRGEPNHFHLDALNVTFVGEATTVNKWPLIVATDYNIPFLLNKPGHGRHVRGELCLVDKAAKEWLDEFEGVQDNIYSVLPVEVRDHKSGALQRPYAYLLDKFRHDLLDSRVLFESYSSINDHYGPYNTKDDRPENANHVFDQIKKQEQQQSTTTTTTGIDVDQHNSQQLIAN